MKKISIHTTRAVFAVFLLALSSARLISCNSAKPGITVRSEIIIGESPQLSARNLDSGMKYTISVEMTDSFQRLWRSEADFRADEYGRINLSHHIPIDDIYNEPDPFGLLSSMAMPTPTPQDWEPPTPGDFNQITFKLLYNSITIDSSKTRQWIFPPNIRSEQIKGEIIAEIFYPGDISNLPGILLLGGSGGGMSWARRNAAVLARKGFAAMAVAYFNAEGLPPHLVEIPLEYIELCLDSLKSHPEVNPERISMVGYSKGAELALLIASRRPDVSSVVVFAPGSAVFQGFRAPDYPVISSWSVGGIGLPFVPNAYDRKFFETFDGMYLWYRTLAQHDAFSAAAIPVEKINGDILLLSGIEDQIWPATFMAEQIIARLHVNDYPFSVRHLAFPEAGHGIAAPPGEPLISVAERLGGTVEGNARARAEGWQAMVDFLSRESGK